MTNKDDILQTLSFEPDWARQPAGSYVNIPFSKERESSGRHSEKYSKKRPPRHARQPSDRQAPRNPAYGDTLRQPQTASERQVPELPHGLYHITFIPERRGLKRLVSQLGRTRRAWPLPDLAKMFLSKPEFYAVKLEVNHSASREETTEPELPLLCQCTECLQIFQTKDEAYAHALQQHFALYFDEERQSCEPPKGNFAVVARCGLSGKLLGPPNYHLYNDKISETHRQKYPDMPLENYRDKIINETDPKFLEQWKAEVSLQTVYHTKKETEQQSFERLTEAESFFMAAYAPAIVREGQRFIIPGVVAQNIADPALLKAVKQTWFRENRSPMRITLAVHPAFKQLGLYSFRDADKTIFMTSILPRPLGEEVQTTPEVAFVLQYVAENPGCKTAELEEAWKDKVAKTDQPTTGADTEQVSLPLRWLIDKGHIIEFFDGKLALPYIPEKRQTTEDAQNHPPQDEQAST